MKQILIVEGKDAIVLSKLCKLRSLPPPTGYSNPEKYQTEFVRESGGIDNALLNFEEALGQEFGNIGLVVDANDNGPDSRWAKIKSILSGYFSEETLKAIAPKPEGIVVQEQGLPSVGIWIMPDNQSPGYLEHFVAGMIPDGDKVWGFAEITVGQLEREEFCRFKAAKHQKALVHTWLAWQEEPGKPFGTALESKYLDANAPAVEPFLKWMKRTFQLG